MSYILEALKKAQAERQLGNAPSIHAPQPVQVNAAAGDAAAKRKPLLVGLGGGALVLVAGAALMWQRGPAPVAPAAPTAAVATSAATPAATPAPNSSANGAATLAVRAPDTPPPAPAAPRAAPAPAPVAVAAVPTPVPVPASAQRAGADARVAVAPTPSAAAAQPPMTAPPGQRQAAPAPENSLPLVQQLPEAIRSQIPRVAFGGYMYSANPADRLVLIDNVLRHEGEEVAPGLVLEKLMPKAALMNFRGVRYRVAY